MAINGLARFRGTEEMAGTIAVHRAESTFPLYHLPERGHHGGRGLPW